MRVTAFYQDVTRVKADIFVAGFMSEIRPPRGLVGKVDWYLGGFISHQIIERTLDARPGEMTLVAVQGKLLTPRLLVVGLGERPDLDQEEAAVHFRHLGSSVRNLGLRSVALEIPQLETPRSGSFPIMGQILKGFRAAFKDHEVPRHCEIQVLARTEEESEGWRKIIRGLSW